MARKPSLDTVVNDVLTDIGAIDPVPEMLPYDQWADIVDWLEKRFYLYDTADLLTLEPPQRAPLREAVRRDSDGNFVYHTVLWSWIKKSAKSTIIAGVVDYFCWHKPRSRWRLIANDLRQADSRVGMYLRESIKLGRKLGYPDDDDGSARRFRERTNIKTSGYQITYPNGSVIEMVPIDPQGEAGGNDDGLVFSELWGWKNEAQKLMWAEATISPTRHGKAQRWIDTYAGFEGESPILEPLYEQIVIEGEHIPQPHNEECYRSGGMFATWVTQPLLSWQTKAYRDAEREALDPEQFDRMHCNQWSTSTERFVPDAWLTACRHAPASIPPLGRYEEILVAIDAAMQSDCFGMAAISRAPAAWRQAHGYEDTDEVYIVRYARRWIPPKRGLLSFYKTVNEYGETVEAELDRLTTDYNVVQVAYDPYQLEHFVQQQIDKGKAWYMAFQQGGERLIADKFLYDTIRERRLVHDGNPHLTDHVLNANRQSTGERTMRLVKRKDSLKIDVAVALSMALHRASQWIPK